MHCIVCKKKLQDNYSIVHDNVRDDITKSSKIIKCDLCCHIQLFGYRENLKQHYDKDLQTFDAIGNLRDLNLNTIISKEKVEINRRLQRLDINMSNKTILDIGGGYCTFSKVVRDKYENVNITVFEPSKTRSKTGEKLNSIKENDNISIINNYLDDKYANMMENKFDYVFLWHVLEHVDEKNINNLIQNLFKVCKKGGMIVIEVPNGNDELFKFEKYKNINYMIHHISYFTKNTLEILLRQNNILNYKIDFVQRYGFKNYLNWTYKLNYNLKDDMYVLSNNEAENLWIEGKIKNENTDALWLELYKN